MLLLIRIWLVNVNTHTIRIEWNKWNGLFTGFSVQTRTNDTERKKCNKKSNNNNQKKTIWYAEQFFKQREEQTNKTKLQVSLSQLIRNRLTTTKKMVHANTPPFHKVHDLFSSICFILFFSVSINLLSDWFALVLQSCCSFHQRESTQTRSRCRLSFSS